MDWIEDGCYVSFAAMEVSFHIITANKALQRRALLSGEI
jgi:hypothetical protein